MQEQHQQDCCTAPTAFALYYMVTTHGAYHHLYTHDNWHHNELCLQYSCLFNKYAGHKLCLLALLLPIIADLLKNIQHTSTITVSEFQQHLLYIYAVYELLYLCWSVHGLNILGNYCLTLKYD